MGLWRKRLGCGGGVLVAVLGLFFAPPLPPALKELQQDLNLRILDRQGRLLRRVLPESLGGVQQPLSLEQISPSMVQATLASEDQRFLQHWGVDLWAVARAARQNWQAGTVVQGGSTLTQQLVRRLGGGGNPPENIGRRERGWSTKLQESYWALRLERVHSKRRILEAYLNLVPYGFQTHGIEAAAQLYFGRPASQLSLAQSSFLAVLPRAPESFRPYQRPEEIQRYQRALLGRMQTLGMIDEAERRRAEAEPLNLRPLDSTFEAGHFCDYLLGQLPPHRASGDLTTTLDLELQQAVEGILKVHLKRLQRRRVSNAAVVVLEVASGEVLAMAGSVDYRLGQFNACLAGRQAGSTLKPFTYGLGLSRGLTAASLLPDLNLYPTQGQQSFIPRNYDQRFHGPVSLREALACSYNVPVVRVLEQVGIENLLQTLRTLEFSRLTESAHHYGLGLTLGVGDVSLLELARAYRCLARHGRYSRERAWRDQPLPPDTQVLEPAVADLLSDILQDPQARAASFGLNGPLRLPYPCAVKTGTSKGYRDNWTVGYTPLYVVACWVGNFDGRSMGQGVSGITGAAPIFRDVFNTLVQRDGGSPDFRRDPDLVQRRVCSLSGQLPGSDCPQAREELFLSRFQPQQSCAMHIRYQGRLYCQYPPLYRSWALAQGIPQPPPRRTGLGQSTAITFPDHNAVFRLDPHLRGDYQQLHLRIRVPDWCQRVEWQIGGRSYPTSQSPFDLWWPLTRGRFTIAAQAHGKGRQESARPISITVQ